MRNLQVFEIEVGQKLRNNDILTKFHLIRNRGHYVSTDHCKNSS